MKERPIRASDDARPEVIPSQPSRRTLLAALGATTLSGLPAVAIAQNAEDPVFDAIRAWEETVKTERAAYALDEAHWGQPDHEAFFEAGRETAWPMYAAESEVMATTPTTLAGAHALVRFVQERVEQYDYEYGTRDLLNAVLSLAKFIDGAQNA